MKARAKIEIARALREKAVDRLVDIPIEFFSQSDLILMLKLAMEEERKAVGLPCG